MTDSNKTLIAALLDRSGSMSTSKTATEDGFNELINKQRSEPGEAIVSLAQFDDAYEHVYLNKPIADVPPLDLLPRGMTAMNDAIGKYITEIGDGLAALPEGDRPGLVICLIMTDGMENASQEWTGQQVKELIEQQETVYGWKFLFLGSGIDAIKEGADRGVSAGASLTYDANQPVAVAAAFAATSNMMGAMRGGNLDASYADADREAAVGKKGDKARKLTGSSR